MRFRYGQGKFETNYESSRAQCWVFYKENDRPKPTTCYFPYSNEVEGMINKITDAIQISGNYTSEETCSQFTWFHKGHIFDTYEDPQKMFYAALESGNLKLEKKDYAKHEWYALSLAVSKNMFKAFFVYRNMQFINKELAAKKSSPPTSSGASECVICLENPAEMLINPCGHACICEACVPAFCPPGSSPVCPLCRGSIISIIKMYR